VADVEDYDLVFVVVDPVAHAILTSPGSPESGERLAQRHPDDPGPLQ
jgi:hypothetical protein